MKYTISIIFIMFYFFSSAQELMRFKVVTGQYDSRDCPIVVTRLATSIIDNVDNIQLIELSNNNSSLNLQIDKNEKKLWFILEGLTPKNTTRQFAIIKNKKKFNIQQIDLNDINGALQMSYKEKPILNYQYELVYPPKGVDSLYKKSGFIHPLWTPDGEVLTRIQPPDHYHHYGIWGPWTKTKIGSRQVDFWNLGEGQGAVLFKKFTQKKQGNVYSGFTALQEHVDFNAKDENRIAINENLKVRAWNLGENKTWLVDYFTEINSPLKNGIIFDAYRYGGGIGFRATEIWHKDNTQILTSEMKDRIDADGSSARWTIIEGKTNTKSGKGGILFMSDKKNKRFPEPMRIWPIDANGGRGDLFFEFTPIRDEPWIIESGKYYNLKYRMLIFEGTLSAEEAEIAWQGFVNPPKVIIVTDLKR